MAPHSSTLAWKIPWTEEPGRLPSMGSLRVRHDFTFTFTFHFLALKKAMATLLQCSCPENPRDGGAWWAAVCGVAQSWTGLKRRSSSSGGGKEGFGEVENVFIKKLCKTRHKSTRRKYTRKVTADRERQTAN